MITHYSLQSRLYDLQEELRLKLQDPVDIDCYMLQGKILLLLELMGEVE